MIADRTPIRKEPLKQRLLLRYADKAVISTRQDYKEIKEYFLKRTVSLPRYVKRKLANRYAEIHNNREQRWANVWLRKTTKAALKILDACPFDNKKALRRDEFLEQYARQAADYCLATVTFVGNDQASESYKENLIHCYTILSNYCEHWHVVTPYSHVQELEESHFESAILRMCCEKWWLRKLTRIRNHTNEHLLIALGEVRKGFGNSPYISHQSFNEWKTQQKANQDYLALMEVVNESTGDAIGLDIMAEATTANPEKRRIELMVRCRGLEELADDDGYSALFLTITAPSKYHAAPNKKGELNKNYDGYSPKETQAYLVNTWAKIRAKLARDEVNYYGVRVVEPHHDGTPHWHLLLFVNPTHKEQLINTCKKQALKVDGNEKGAQKHRFTVEEIDPEKGSATGYIAKYISKNINGSKMDAENDIDYEAETTADEGAKRATAWASRWNIRQFQFFGAASVSLYREFRRLDGEAICEHAERVRAEADAGRWAEFTKELRKTECRLAYDIEQGGNRYGEAVRRVSGITTPTSILHTRLEKYAIRKRGSGSPWSPVNNCTVSSTVAAELRKVGIPDELFNVILNGGKVKTDPFTAYQIKNNRLQEITCEHY